MIKIISFDLQGTLSDGAFSDEFWSETLPMLYARQKQISLQKAKELLRKKFNSWGRYDYRYYSQAYWLNELGISSFSSLVEGMKCKPLFYPDTVLLLEKLRLRNKLIIVSSTTKEFLDLELGKHAKYFSEVFSSLDDFNIAGKPPELYIKIASILGVCPDEIFHVGDSEEMDVKNAKEAGWETFFFDRKIPRRQLLEKLERLLTV
jgi:FMN phosphatase YigB (HAD superfamily)